MLCFLIFFSGPIRSTPTFIIEPKNIPRQPIGQRGHALFLVLLFLQLLFKLHYLQTQIILIFNYCFQILVNPVQHFFQFLIQLFLPPIIFVVVILYSYLLLETLWDNLSQKNKAVPDDLRCGLTVFIQILRRDVGFAYLIYLFVVSIFL